MLLNSQGPLSRVIPSAAISSANSEVFQVTTSQTERGQTLKSRKAKRKVYSPKERAEIGKLACNVGATEAAERFSKKCGFSINESTVRTIKKAYLASYARKD